MQLKDVVDEPDIPDDEKEREIARSRLLERLAADPTTIRMGGIGFTLSSIITWTHWS